MSKSINMAVWIEITVLQSIEIAYRTQMTVSKTLETAS